MERFYVEVFPLMLQWRGFHGTASMEGYPYVEASMEKLPWRCLNEGASNGEGTNSHTSQPGPILMQGEMRNQRASTGYSGHVEPFC